MENAAVLTYLYALDRILRSFYLLDCRESVPAVEAQLLNDLHTVCLLDREDKPLHEAVVYDLVTAVEADAAFNELPVVHLLPVGLLLHSVRGDKAPDLPPYGFGLIVVCHHSN